MVDENDVYVGKGDEVSITKPWPNTAADMSIVV